MALPHSFVMKTPKIRALTITVLNQYCRVRKEGSISAVKKCRHECRHGTHECVRHAERDLRCSLDTGNRQASDSEVGPFLKF